MRGRFRLADAARALTPMHQGDLDRLSGVYAMMNAVRLALYPDRLNRSQLSKLAAPGFKALGTSRRFHVVICDEMIDRVWEKVAAAIVEEVARRHHHQLTVGDLLASTTPGSTLDAIRAVSQALGRGEPVVLLLARRYDHWTVAVGYTKTRVFLFDSFGHRWIDWSSIALEGAGVSAPHGLARAYALRRDPA